MKFTSRLLALLILALLLVIPLSAQGVTYVRPRFSSLNVRTGPGIENAVLTEIYGTASYPVLDRSLTGNWLLIDLGFTQGWVHQAYVIETTYSTSAVVVNPGQGGGFVMPATTTTSGYVIPVVSVTGTTNIGQGGGFAAPTTTTVQTSSNISTTVGSWVALNLRNGPDTTYGIVAIMPQGDRAIPLGRNARGTWYYVEYNGVRGWVTHELVAVPPTIDVVALPVVSNE